MAHFLALRSQQVIYFLSLILLLTVKLDHTVFDLASCFLARLFLYMLNPEYRTSQGFWRILCALVLGGILILQTKLECRGVNEAESTMIKSTEAVFVCHSNIRGYGLGPGGSGKWDCSRSRRLDCMQVIVRSLELESTSMAGCH